MSAAHVRRGAPARGQARKAAPRVSCRSGSRRTAGRRRRANRLAALGVRRCSCWRSAVVALIALDIPAKAAAWPPARRSATPGSASAASIVQGINRMDRAGRCGHRRRVALGPEDGTAPMPLVDVAAHPRAAAAVRLGQGCARVAALARHAGDRHRRAHAGGAVAGRAAAVADRRRRRGARPRAGRPDARPAAADRAGRQRARRASSTRCSTRRRRSKPQLASATWIGQRRWDLSFQTGETVALPEGERRGARRRWPSSPRSTTRRACSGAGIVRFDLRIPGKMTVRLPRAPGEPIVPEARAES